jgi:MFS family permease
MIGVLIASSTISSTALLPRFGPRLLVPVGLFLAAIGMVLFTGLEAHSTYAAHVLPGLLVLGVGIGLISAPAMNTATRGVEPGDAGVASATVNTAQQVGGSLGIALLNTVATTATASFVAGKAAAPSLAAAAAVHGYTTAFWWAAAIFAAGAVACGLLLRPGIPGANPQSSSPPREMVRGQLREPTPRAQPEAQPLAGV